MSRAACGALVAMLYIVLSAAAYGQQSASAKVEFQLESQALSDAVTAWAQQAQLQLIWPTGTSATTSQIAPQIKGRFAPEEALHLLLQGSGLTYSFVDKQTVAIREISAASTRQTRALRSDILRVVDIDQGAGDRLAPATADDRDQKSSSRRSDARPQQVETLQEIIVTGTHIRGQDNSASPMLVFQRQDIEATGVTTIQEFFQKLPQNFGGGANPANTLRTPQAGDDSSTLGFGSSLNIRGLGAGTTLTLVNGHRLAPSDSGAFVDVSMIPLSAVERIDVVTDGASAIYGSDAVGAVVNVVLRKEYDGLETSLRYGLVTKGDYKEKRFSQAAGAAWEGGQVIATFEHLDQDKLRSVERDFSRGAPFPWDLIPSATSNSVFGSISQSLGDRTSITGDGYYARRKSDFSANAGFPMHENALVEQYGGVLAGAAKFNRDWQLQVAGGYSVNSVRDDTQLLFGTLVFPDQFRRKSDGWYVDLVADGPIAQLAGGALRVAFGATHRQEQYGSKTESNPDADFDDKRKVDAVFLEATAPLIGTENSIPGFRRLELTAAVRRDRYSDFGSTTNPKFGLVWEMTPSVRVRGSHSRSFRAPTFSELSPQSASSSLALLQDPASPTGQTITLFADGGNPDLGPETATVWTTGLEWRPQALAGFTANLNYYDISYSDRVALPTGNTPGVFSQESVFASLINRNPTPSEIDRFVNIGGFGFTIFSEGPFAVPAGVDQSSTQAIADLRLHNLASTEQRGLDLQLAYPMTTGIGDIGLSLNANYILDSTKRITQSAPAQTSVNTIYNPVDLRVRAGLTIQHNKMFGAAFLNHAANYADNTSSPSIPIGSWTTVDGVFGYTVERRGQSVLNSVKVQASIQNMFDRDPPFVNNLRGTGFDPTNASPLGRFVSVDVSASW